eukprot:2588925-Prymnesium_polylepis.2
MVVGRQQLLDQSCCHLSPDACDARARCQQVVVKEKLRLCPDMHITHNRRRWWRQTRRAELQVTEIVCVETREIEVLWHEPWRATLRPRVGVARVPEPVGL